MKTVLSSFIGAAAFSLAFAAAPTLRAADHGDAPTLGPDQGCDIADIFAFLDPNDNDSVVLVGTSRGFIVPSEAGNFALFDPNVRFTFAIENTGDAIPDLFIDVEFDPRAIKTGASSASQDAFVSLRGVVPTTFAGKKGKFGPLPVTQPSLATTAPDQVVTLDLTNTANATTGISFFAGEVDDPFFFDIPGFNRFVGSVLGGTPDGSFLSRGRDSFAGYNVLGIAIKVPATLLRNAKVKAPALPRTQIGVSFITARGSERTVKGVKVKSGAFQQVDRMGIPGVNVAFVGYNRKNAFNGGSTLDDAKGAFFGDIAPTLLALGTSGVSLDTLAAVTGLPSVTNATTPTGVKLPLKDKTKFGTGDFLRLETDKTLAPNIGAGGGTGVQLEDATAQNPARGFPNGRRLKDDVIDTVLFLVTNGLNAGSSPVTAGDNVNASDVTPQDAFPFLAKPQQPREGAGNIEDNTRN